ncbi:MAG: cytochrome c-type biogenesis CcmF C-terminal domain-containing protein [Thermodesulfobacteriota bacterium]|nr:cytochrome c-type biogenesis CcmF C-terminal domain-containing protein [Thermodesulfobacteriota bacterium]
MINIIGDNLIFISFLFILLSFLSYSFSFYKKNSLFSELGKRSLSIVLIILTFAIFLLEFQLITKDYSNLYVAKNVSNDLSTIFSMTSLWAGQAGSLMLWTWILAIYLFIENKKSLSKLIPASRIIGTFTLGFFIYLICFVENPFETADKIYDNGRGLNPILQNIYMSIHPLSLYLGYIGITIPFCFGIAAIISKDKSNDWISESKKWTYFSWTFLSIGLLLGSRWAYLELGWGGYWAWDPVENVALMPWLLLTAFIHSSYAQEQKKVLRRWNLLLIFLAFFLSIFGTFITRSGLISSVHSFAQSSIGNYFIVFIILILLSSAFLYYRNKIYIESEKEIKSLYSKENFFVFNNILFLVITFTVLVGTIFPIISEFFTGKRILVGPSFYDLVNFPNVLMLILLMTFAPFLPWEKGNIKPVLRYLKIPFLFSLALSSFTFLKFESLNIFIVFLLSLTTLFSICKEFIIDLRINKNSIDKKFRRYCSFIVHFGVIIMIMGVSFSSNFEKKYDITMGEGEEVLFGDLRLRLDDIYEKETPAKSIIGANIVLKKNNNLYNLTPEQNLYKYEGNREINKETEVAIYSTFLKDYYLILVDKNIEGKLNLKLYINPLVSFLWLGSLISIIGGSMLFFRRKLND